MSTRETAGSVLRGAVSGRMAFPAVVFAIAFLLRLALLPWGAGFPSDSGDAPSYLAIARSLAAGTGFSLDGVSPTASRTPLYPLFLAAVSAIPGPDAIAVKVAQSLIGAFTCVLVFFLASNLLGRRYGKIAAVLAAAYLPAAVTDLSILSEPLFAFFTVAGMACLSGRGAVRARALTGGLLFGLSALARPNGLVTIIFLVVWMAALREYRRHAIPFLLAAAVVILPWVARNAMVFHRFIPAYTLSGITFYNSYVLPENGFGFNSLRGVPDEYFTLPDEGARDAYLTALTVRHIREHPREALSLLPVKLGLLAYPFDLRWLDPRFPLRYNVFWGAIFLLAAVGIGTCAAFLPPRGSLFWAPFAGLLFTAAVLYGSPRIRMPFDYLLMVPAAAGVFWIRERGRWWWFALAQVIAAVLGIWPGFFPWLRSLLRG